MVTANAAALLLEHYVDNFRQLPWRAAPKVSPGEPPPDPYRVWLSEIMLQQTTVATVIPRFERFVARWPTIEALAAASDEEILSEWAGLGYYARARNLIGCARKVAERGEFPVIAALLRELPGIGDYTAAAIAAIAFGEQIVAVDTNVARLIARLHALERPPKADVQAIAEAMSPAGRSGDFTQAMMDLGATICRPKRPRCGACPLRAECAAFASGTPEAFPAPRPRRVRQHKYGVAYWIERDDDVWLVRRPAKGVLGGMAALPGSEWTEKGEVCPPNLGTVRHVFSHFSLDLAIVRHSEPVGEGWWQPIGRLADAGLPTLYRKAVAAVLARDERTAV